MPPTVYCIQPSLISGQEEGITASNLPTSYTGRHFKNFQSKDLQNDPHNKQQLQTLSESHCPQGSSLMRKSVGMLYGIAMGFEEMFSICTKAQVDGGNYNSLSQIKNTSCYVAKMLLDRVHRNWAGGDGTRAFEIAHWKQ